MNVGSEIQQSYPLFPHRLRFVGFIFISLSLIAAYLYFWKGRPAFFEMPVFAFVTSYAETRWMVVAQTNALDEIAVILGIIGLLFTAFSKETHETELITSLRVRTLFHAVYITTGIWLFLYLVVYGWPVIVLSASVFILFLLIYIIIFRSCLVKAKYFSKKSEKRQYLTSYSHEI